MSDFDDLGRPGMVTSAALVSELEPSTPVRFTLGSNAEWVTLRVCPVGVVTDLMKGLAAELVLGAMSSPRMKGLLPLSVKRAGSSANETETWPPALEIVAGMIANVEPTP